MQSQLALHLFRELQQHQPVHHDPNISLNYTNVLLKWQICEAKDTKKIIKRISKTD